MSDEISIMRNKEHACLAHLLPRALLLPMALETNDNPSACANRPRPPNGQGFRDLHCTTYPVHTHTEYGAHKEYTVLGRSTKPYQELLSAALESLTSTSVGITSAMISG